MNEGACGLQGADVGESLDAGSSENPGRSLGLGGLLTQNFGSNGKTTSEVEPSH